VGVEDGLRIFPTEKKEAEKGHRRRSGQLRVGSTSVDQKPSYLTTTATESKKLAKNKRKAPMGPPKSMS
jgi:hypothetical protein